MKGPNVLNILESGFMSKGGIAQNLERTFQDSPVWWFEYSPSKLSANVEVHPTERVGNVGLARYSEHVWSDSVAIVPGPMGAEQVVHRLVFACALDDGHLCCFVVTKLGILWCKEWL